MEDKKEDVAPLSEATVALNVQISELSKSIEREAAVTGGANILLILTNLHMLMEHVHMLTGMVMDQAAQLHVLNPGVPQLTDEDVTTILAGRLKVNIAERDAFTQKTKGQAKLVEVVRGNLDTSKIRHINGQGGPRR
jgi:hypothetical protein